MGKKVQGTVYEGVRFRIFFLFKRRIVTSDNAVISYGGTTNILPCTVVDAQSPDAHMKLRDLLESGEVQDQPDQDDQFVTHEDFAKALGLKKEKELAKFSRNIYVSVKGETFTLREWFPERGGWYRSTDDESEYDKICDIDEAIVTLITAANGFDDQSK